MRRASYWTGVVVVTAVTGSFLTTGCTRDGSLDNGANLARTGAKSALTAAVAVGDRGLPEIVVSARKPGAETTAMSDRNAAAAQGMSPIPAHRQ